jgi:hypothetical protein
MATVFTITNPSATDAVSAGDVFSLQPGASVTRGYLTAGVKAAIAAGNLKVSPSLPSATVVALTDNSGGTSGGNTIAAITVLADATNAIATLAAKLNAVIAVIAPTVDNATAEADDVVTRASKFV